MGIRLGYLFFLNLDMFTLYPHVLGHHGRGLGTVVFFLRRIHIDGAFTSPLPRSHLRRHLSNHFFYHQALSAQKKGFGKGGDFVSRSSKFHFDERNRRAMSLLAETLELLPLGHVGLVASPPRPHSHGIGAPPSRRRPTTANNNLRQARHVRTDDRAELWPTSTTHRNSPTPAYFYFFICGSKLVPEDAPAHGPCTLKARWSRPISGSTIHRGHIRLCRPNHFWGRPHFIFRT